MSVASFGHGFGTKGLETTDVFLGKDLCMYVCVCVCMVMGKVKNNWILNTTHKHNHKHDLSRCIREAGFTTIAMAR